MDSGLRRNDGKRHIHNSSTAAFLAKGLEALYPADMADNIITLLSASLYVIPATVWAYAKLTIARATLARAQAEAERIRMLPPG
jgi:hypothetical protein